MSRAETFILAGGEDQRLHPLTRGRAKAILPFGGVYRLIDFTLSNCINSGLPRINILTQYQWESVHSYIRALTFGKQENSTDEALLCLCPVSGKRYRGTADAVFQNISILENTAADIVIILSADHVYKMDYRDLLRFHIDSGADATLAAVEYPRSAASQFGVLQTDSDGYATVFEEKPRQPVSLPGRPYDALVSIGVYVFNVATLADVLRQDARENTSHDFGNDIIPGLVAGRRVSVYNFTEKGTRLGSYWRDVGTLDAYYRVNMELLLNSFYDPYAGAGWPLYGLDASQARRFGQTGRRATNPAIHSGIPEDVLLGPGSQVVHSVISPGVKIGGSSEIHSSILMHNAQIGGGVRIRRAIVDQNVRIDDGVRLGYDMTRDRKHGFLTDSGILVIPADTHVGAPKAFFQVQ